MNEPKTDKQRHWAKILDEAESSGMSLADYARANNIGVQTLYHWRSALKHRRERPPKIEGQVLHCHIT